MRKCGKIQHFTGPDATQKNPPPPPKKRKKQNINPHPLGTWGDESWVDLFGHCNARIQWCPFHVSCRGAGWRTSCTNCPSAFLYFVASDWWFGGFPGVDALHHRKKRGSNPNPNHQSKPRPLGDTLVICSVALFFSQSGFLFASFNFVRPWEALQPSWGCRLSQFACMYIWMRFGGRGR